MKYILIACLALFIFGCTNSYKEEVFRERKVTRSCYVCCESFGKYLRDFNVLDCTVKFHSQLHAMDDDNEWAAIAYCDDWIKSYKYPKVK